MDGVEHLGSFLEAHISIAPKERATPAAALAYMESEEAAPLYACLAERGVAVTPTLVVYPAVAQSRFDDGPLPVEFITFIEAMKRIALRLHRSGVPLLAGTDAASTGALEIAPGLSLLDELEMLQSSGIPAADIVAIATSNAAKALGVETMKGSIAPGKDADFLLLDADPGADAANFRKLRAVYRAGKRIAQSRPGETP